MSPADDGLTRARAAIAAAVLDVLPDDRLGEIRLWPEQRRIVARALRSLRDHGGALVAEDVGRGKTYIALAIARTWERPLVVAPAALVPTWRDAMRRAAVPCAIVSHESLSRGRAPPASVQGIIVDESHHFRTPGTRRHDLLVAAATVPVVLLSATPLQNRRADLATQLALFLGSSADLLGDDALARYVIRGGDDTDARLPPVRAPQAVPLGVDDSRVLRAILALPEPPGPLDGGDGGALRTLGLVRAWASSRAALEATLRSRLRIATAFEQGIEAGRTPTKRDLRAWTGGEDAVQLGFAALLMDAVADGTAGVREALDAERAGIAGIQCVLKADCDPDEARASALRELRERHAGERLLVFSERASTVRALYGLLHGDAGVGMLTATGGRIASGRIAREELLALFAPRSQHARPAPARSRVTMLLTTDILSEGLNLQDASVVVHLDLPWNPARLTQRVGRVRRPGQLREVTSYVFAPPAHAELLVKADVRLHRKIEEAARVMGSAMPVLPASGVDAFTNDAHDATTFGAVLARIEPWRTSGTHARATAATRSLTEGWIAALDDGRLLCSMDGVVSESASALLRGVVAAEGPACDASVERETNALAMVNAMLAAEQLERACGLATATSAQRRQLLVWLDSCARSAMRHERTALLHRVAALRAVLSGPLPLGVERRLAGQATNADTLAALRACEDIVAPVRARQQCIARPDVAALILFCNMAQCSAGPATRR
ncbi:MAG: DEAD/DEAH box helicase [Gemmatimonadaceae bacterium]